MKGVHETEEKLVIIKDMKGKVIDVLLVHNYDYAFEWLLIDAERAWQNSEDTYNDFIYSELCKDGYRFEVITDEVETLTSIAI